MVLVILFKKRKIGKKPSFIHFSGPQWDEWLIRPTQTSGQSCLFWITLHVYLLRHSLFCTFSIYEIGMKMKNTLFCLKIVTNKFKSIKLEALTYEKLWHNFILYGHKFWITNSIKLKLFSKTSYPECDWSPFLKQQRMYGFFDKKPSGKRSKILRVALKISRSQFFKSLTIHIPFQVSWHDDSLAAAVYRVSSLFYYTKQPKFSYLAVYISYFDYHGIDEKSSANFTFVDYGLRIWCYFHSNI